VQLAVGKKKYEPQRRRHILGIDRFMAVTVELGGACTFISSHHSLFSREPRIILYSSSCSMIVLSYDTVVLLYLYHYTVVVKSSMQIDDR
jgi:hypothetical protein